MIGFPASATTEAQAMREAAAKHIEVLQYASQHGLERLLSGTLFHLFGKIAAEIRALPLPQPNPAVEAMAAALERLMSAAKLLQANCEGCAVNHHGADFEQQGLPGWLADTQADIENARAALATYRASKEQGGRT